MKKFLNIRPFVFGFFAIVLGIFFAISCFLNLLFLIPLVFVLFFLGICLFFKKFRQFAKKYIIVFVQIAVFFAVGVMSFAVAEVFYRNNLPESGNQTVVGRIESFKVENGKTVFELDNVKIDGEKFSGVFWVSIFSIEGEYKVGQTVAATGKVNPSSHFENGKFEKKYASSKIVAFVFAENVEITNENIKLNFFEEIRGEFKKVFFSNMNEKEAALSFGMFFGDTSEIDDATISSFRTSGIAHLLAVSGLNVGFLILILSFFFDLCRVNKKIKFFLISFIIVLYAGTCGFSASVVRAGVMGIILLFAGFRGKQYDALSALAVTGILILTFSPISIFDVGFLLSFSAVFSILCLVPVLNSFFLKIYPQKMSSAISVTIAATVGTFPISLSIFEIFSPFSILTNLLVVPVACFSYILSFIFVLIVLPFGFLGFVLIIPELLLKFVSSISFVVSKFPFSQISLNGSILFSICFLVMIFVIGEFFFVEKKTKTLTSLSLLLFSIIFLVCANL